MNTPHELAGVLYTTDLVQRCTNYNQCAFCKMCRNFDCQNETCLICESRKSKTQAPICTCTNEMLGIFRQLEDRSKGSFAPIEGLPPGTTDLGEVVDNVDNRSLHQQIKEEFQSVGTKADFIQEKSAKKKFVYNVKY